MSYSQLKFIHSKMLTQICEFFKLEPNRDNKEAMKAVLKTVSGIDTLGRMDDDDDLTHNIRLSLFIQKSAVFMASEFGLAIDFPWEDDVETQDMKSFLKYIYHDNRPETKVTENSGASDEVHDKEMGDG